MKRKLRTLTLLITFTVLYSLSTVLCAQSERIENVRYSVTDDKMIVIYYDLIGRGTYNISVKVSTDNGRTFLTTPKALSGDVGDNIRQGVSKRIVWDVLRDVRELSGDVVFEVFAVAESNNLKGPLTGMEFVKIPAGSFVMGSPSNESYRDNDEGPQRTVHIKSFYMMTTEVTQKMWFEVMGNHPSNWKGDNLPVDQVSWNACHDFIKKLNARYPGKNFRLPTEAEWEYACRAGTTTRFYSGNSESDLARAGWYIGNSGSKTHPVGQKVPNAWGLYDMHGNVWEWCEDWYHDSYQNAPTDGSAWVSPSGSFYVLRGGSWSSVVWNCRSADRDRINPLVSNYDVGLRLVSSP